VRRSLTVAVVVGMLAVPGAARASDTPSAADRQNASQDCRAERGATAATRAAFKARYGTNRNKSNAFGKCVSQAAKAAKQAADDQDEDSIADRKSAAKQCAQERGTTAESRDAFAKKYGTNADRANAFGKCVSKVAKSLDDDS
jgi:hypothetical protein